MKILPLCFIWCISFMFMGYHLESLNFMFWFSFLVFSAVCIHMSKNAKRLEKKIDEIFDKLRF